MRTLLTLACTCAILTGVLTTGGCAKKTTLDEALAANRRLKATLEKSMAAQEQLRSQNDALSQQVTAKDKQLAAADNRYQVLNNKHAELTANFDQLGNLYRKLKAEKPGDVTFGGAALPEEMDKALAALAAQHGDLMQYLPQQGMVKFKSDLTFPKGSDTPGANAEGALRKLAAVLNTPTAQAYHVYVAGHTDDMRIARPDTKRRHPTNWYLSVHRAVAVQQILQEAGVAPQRIGAMGFGEYHPIEPNKPGKKGNPVNRRVEIWIVPKSKQLTMDGAAAPSSPSGPAVVPAGPVK